MTPRYRIRKHHDGSWLLSRRSGWFMKTLTGIEWKALRFCDDHPTAIEALDRALLLDRLKHEAPHDA